MSHSTPIRPIYHGAFYENAQDAYLETREEIEECGRDARWEFEREKLFGRTRHMAESCTLLLAISERLDEMRSRLSCELKSVTGVFSLANAFRPYVTPDVPYVSPACLIRHREYCCR